jgi:uridine kinase
MLVGFDGIDGAGKTTLAEELVPVLEGMGAKVVRDSIDGFHNPREVRIAKGELDPVGYFEDSFDYVALKQQLLDPIKDYEKPFAVPSAKFDWKSDSKVKGATLSIDADTILLFEGVFLFREELIEYWDFKIFVEIDFELSLRRGIERDSALLGGREATENKYKRRYIPGQKLYFEHANPKAKANLVVINNNPDEPSLIVNEMMM